MDNKMQRKPVVVCFHSSAGAPGQWRALESLLANRFEVVSPALIGYSDANPYRGGKLDLADEARSVMRQIAGFKAPFHLVGHSYGGAVALQFAHQFPVHVASISLFEPAAFSVLLGQEAESGASREIRRMGQFVVENTRDRSRRDTAAWRFINYWSGPGTWEWMDEGLRARVRSLMPKIAAEFRALKSGNLDARILGRLRVPAQLVCGTETRAPARAVCRSLSRLLPNVESHYLPGATHMAPVTNPERVNPVVADFLDRQALSAARMAA